MARPRKTATMMRTSVGVAIAVTGPGSGVRGARQAGSGKRGGPAGRGACVSYVGASARTFAGEKPAENYVGADRIRKLDSSPCTLAPWRVIRTQHDRPTDRVLISNQRRIRLHETGLHPSSRVSTGSTRGTSSYYSYSCQSTGSASIQLGP